MMTPELQEALDWVNHERTGPLRAAPLDELPKGVPGHTAECVIARALKMGIAKVQGVSIQTDTHMFQATGLPMLQGRNPDAVRSMIRKFDAGGIRHLIDYESFKAMNSQGFAMHNMAGVQQSMAKPFNKLLPKLAQFYPELHVNPHSTIEVSQSFDSMMHVVTVKNPGECPKAVELTATMVHQMQKHMEEEMQKVAFPPLHYHPGNLKMEPGGIIHSWEPTPMPITATEVKQLKSMYYAPDWANMMKSPEAPVMVPIEEPAVV